MLMGSSLRVSSRSSWELRYGMLHIYWREMQEWVRSSVRAYKRKKSHTNKLQLAHYPITNMLVIIWICILMCERQIVDYCKHLRGLDFVQQRLIDAGLSTAWFNRETEGMTPRTDWLSSLVDLWAGANLRYIIPHCQTASFEHKYLFPPEPKATPTDRAWLGLVLTFL